MHSTMLWGYFVAISLLWGGFVVDASSHTRIAAPLFAFSNQEYFASAEKRVAASYQVYDDPRSVIYSIVKGAVHPEYAASSGWLDAFSVQQQGPEVVLVVVGRQLRTAQLSDKTIQNALQSLHTVMGQAKSAMTAPYMLHEVSANTPGLGATLDELTSSAVDYLARDCSRLDSDSFAEAVKQLGSKPAVLSVCITVDSSIAGTPEGIADELKQLEDVQRTVAALNKRQITIYATQPMVSELQQRRLLSDNGDVGVCGPLCQTQVKWLEGILAALILALAAFSGMCCLYMLDTPTRFEKPKDGVRTE